MLRIANSDVKQITYRDFMFMRDMLYQPIYYEGSESDPYKL